MPGTTRPEVLSAVPTLFDDAGELDMPGMDALFGSLTGHVDGVFLAGTTGEFPALDRAERHRLAEAALAAFGPAGLVVHVGAASTREAVALARDAIGLGARRLAVLTPYYLPADLDAVGRHFAAVVAAADGAEVYGYLFEERSGVAVGPAEFGRIAGETGLAGAKLSGAANARVGEYIDALPPGVRLWSGSDTTLAALARRGGAGVVSGLSAAFPEPFAALAAAVASGDVEAERVAQERADEVMAALGGTVEGIKEGLRQRGIGSGALRMPAPAVADLDAIKRLAG